MIREFNKQENAKYLDIDHPSVSHYTEYYMYISNAMTIKYI